MLFPLKVLNFKEISRHPINYYDGILTDLRFEKSNFDSAASIKIRTSAMHTKLSKECKKLHYLVACLIFWKKRSQGLEILYGIYLIFRFIFLDYRVLLWCEYSNIIALGQFLIIFEKWVLECAAITETLLTYLPRYLWSKNP